MWYSSDRKASATKDASYYSMQKAKFRINSASIVPLQSRHESDIKY